MKNDSDNKKGIIIGSQIKRARELLQISPNDVAKGIDASILEIREWEEGKKRPNLKQLEYLAELYGREIDYFLRESPEPPKNIEFRGKPGQTISSLSKEAKIVLAKFDELCRNALEFEILLNKKRTIKISKFKDIEEPKIAAQNLRNQLNIGYKPLSDLRDRLENKGVMIFELIVPEDAFSGFSFWHEEYGPCILINAKDIKGRRNFTLAHELAHLLYNHGSSLCYIPRDFGELTRGSEYKANQFAIELLLPESNVEEDFKKRNLSKTPSQQELGNMSYKWGVSIQALGYRLENLMLIEKGFTGKIIESMPPHMKRPKIPEFERQLGKGFVETSFEAYQKGFITSGKLAHSLGITIRKALEEINKRYY